MEREVGEVFEVDGARVICEETKIEGCQECFFKERDCYKHNCTYLHRKDGKNVFFKELKN